MDNAPIRIFIGYDSREVVAWHVLAHSIVRNASRPVHDLCAVNEDLDESLAAMSALDEYVGVSSTNVHLRAGTGRTGRILVPFPPEWRWMAAGDSAWFPGFTVYRQDVASGWDAALGRLRADLPPS